MDKQKEKRKRAPMQHYSESFKRAVIEEYLRTGEPKLILQRKHGIKFIGAICTWMKQLGYTDLYRNVPYFDLKNQIELAAKFSKTIQPSSTDAASIQKRLKELERQLEDEKLRSETYRRMIEIAEKELKVSIRKKSN